MVGLAAVALCYPPAQRLLLLTPIGILLLFSGISRSALGFWFFKKGSRWRKLVQLSATVDLAAGIAAFVLLYLGQVKLHLLIGLWLLLSGFFQHKRYLYLKRRWPACSAVGFVAALSVIGGSFLLASVPAGWAASPFALSATLGMIGLFKIYAFVKLGQIRQCSPPKEQAPSSEAGALLPFYPFNLN